VPVFLYVNGGSTKVLQSLVIFGMFCKTKAIFNFSFSFLRFAAVFDCYNVIIQKILTEMLKLKPMFLQKIGCF